MNYKHCLIIKFINECDSWVELNKMWAIINKIDDRGIKDGIKELFLKKGSILVERETGGNFE